MIPGFFIYIYILIGLFVLIFDAFEWSVKAYNRAFNFLFLLLALLSAFSYGVGADTAHYIRTKAISLAYRFSQSRAAGGMSFKSICSSSE